MSEKICSGCMRMLPLESYGPDKSRPDGREYTCRPCRAAAKKARRANRTPEQLRKDRAAEKAYRENNKEKCYAATMAWRERNWDRFIALHRAWKEKDKPNAARKAREKRATPEGSLHNRMSVMLRGALRGDKSGVSTPALIGYSIAELKRHLERQFLPGMSWENMSQWHIDHIIPKSSFSFSSKDDPEFKRCWALSNLRPLWALDNKKKYDKRTHLL